MYFFLMIDFALNGGISFENESHQFGKYVRGFVLGQYIIITLLKRMVLFINAKRLGRLLEVLSEYQKKDYRRKSGSLQDKIMSALIFVTFTLTCISVVVKSLEFLDESGDNYSYVKYLGFGKWGYSILYFLFAVMPLGIVTNVAYSLIIVISLQVNKIFCNFCDDVRCSLSKLISMSAINGKSNSEIYSILKMGTTGEWERKRNACAAISYGKNKIAPQRSRLVACNGFTSRHQVIETFEELKDLMKLTNESLSPLTLWMISGMTLGTVGNASQLFVSGSQSSRLDLVMDILVLPLLVIYGFLLELGHKIGQMVGFKFNANFISNIKKCKDVTKGFL